MPAPEATGITIYGESWCPFCQEALKLLEELKRTEGTPYKYYNIGDEADSRVKRDAVRACKQNHEHGLESCRLPPFSAADSLPGWAPGVVAGSPPLPYA